MQWHESNYHECKDGEHGSMKLSEVESTYWYSSNLTSLMNTLAASAFIAHFLLECLFYKDIRARFNCMSFDNPLFNSRNLLTCTDESHLRSLAFYIWTCFTLRRDYVELYIVFMLYYRL